ncbi:MAG: polysaccharide biosynthesis/export family protein [Bacteroidetes bacterium]|nr:polysaccharide biosynthesis/export family protein [Bacteroidota bacterium]
MFKTGKDYPYKVDQTIGNVEYRIAPNDILGFSVFTNDGFKLIDLTTGVTSLTATGSSGSQSSSGNNSTRFIVDVEGFVKLPIIGRVKVEELSIREAEKMLEEKFSVYYNKPFVMLNVLNRRVMVFPGTGGSGKVVILENENTTLIEALALAGGITETGKSKVVKLIRGDSRNPQVHLIDLSTVEGMKQSNMLLQASDIIYVEPVKNVSNAVLAKIAPIVGIVTSVLLLYEIVLRR